MSCNSRLRKRVSLCRKLQNLRRLSARKYVKRNCSFMQTALQIFSLKLKLESIRREYINLLAVKTEYLNLINHFSVPKKEVKVEKVGERFLVRVSCEKRQNMLVSVLEAFGKMDINVLHAKVYCKYLFSMEAILVPPEDQALDTGDLTRALLNTIEKKGGEEKQQCSL